MRDKLAIAMIIGFAAAVGSAALAVGYMLAKLYSAPNRPVTATKRTIRAPDSLRKPNQRRVIEATEFFNGALAFRPPTGRLALTAGNAKKSAGRYDNPAFGKGVRPLLTIMHETGLLDFQLPIAMRGEVSSIAATAKSNERV
jgi:hypothetical protein